MTEDKAKTIMDARVTFRRLRAATYDTRTALDRIEGARVQISFGQDVLLDELARIHERVDSFIRELDAANDALDKL